MGDNTTAKANVSFDNPYLSEYDVSYTTNLISELKSKGVSLSNSLYDDIWLFSHEYSLGRSIKLDFGKIDKNLNKDDKLLIKCWIVQYIEKNQHPTCIHYSTNF